MKVRGTSGEVRRGWRFAVFLWLAASSATAAPVVLSVDRLYRPDQSNLSEAGEILLSELHCVNCHAPSGELAKRIPRTRAPLVHNSFTRLQHGYLEKWLANPHGTKAGARMPDLLHGLPEVQRTEAIKALSEFINTLPADPMANTSTIPPGNVARGRELFHSIGCVACHAPRKDFQKTIAGEQVDSSDVKSTSVPLGKLGDKYTWHGLSGFLKAPHSDRPSSRMPRVPMSEVELNDLTWYLRSDETPRKASNQTGQLRLIGKGRQLFSSLGCANCHDATDNHGKVTSTIEAIPLAELNPEGGCLNDSGKAPRFGLDEFQRKALTAALDGIGTRPSMTPTTSAHRKLVALNCYACHQRDGKGGPDDQRLKYFVASASDLGDEGRIPPILTGVGRKLRQDAMTRIIQGEIPARDYMVTRMPDFGAAHAEFLAAEFAKVDHDPNEKPTPRDGEENRVGRNMWGRSLLGTKGLNCITCHTLRGHKSLGIQAIDLAHSARRLRPEWFRDYLLEPAKFRPGTRMPSFWPNGKAMVRTGGSTPRQIDSIWVYLNELNQSRLPEGMEKTGDFLLNPKNKPIVFRTFMESPGMHAIAVGYPAGTHAAFDSLNPRVALAWTGKFLDAESTWDDRFTPLAKPEGDNVVAIQPFTPVHEKNNLTEFRGYQLDLKTGTPIFLYEIAKVKFTDSIVPHSVGGKKLRRTLSMKSGNAAKWIDVANGNKIRKDGRYWVVDEKLRVSTSSNTRALTAQQKHHLQVDVTDTSIITYEW